MTDKQWEIVTITLIIFAFILKMTKVRILGYILDVICIYPGYRVSKAYLKKNRLIK